MDRRLNNFILIVFFLIFENSFSQSEKNVSNFYDYKDKNQFEKFQKRRKIIGAWQINQLKEGALVVKLKTNSKIITELEKIGNQELANKKKLETFLVNKNIMMAYLDNFKFCKLYFINSSGNDSLLNGMRNGIFLDTTLRINPAIEMKEKFYLIAERDNIYNSSIGFVAEDSARYVKEHGNPSGQVVEIVIKNKYGHQLKKPFPYECGYGFGSAAYSVSSVKYLPVNYFETEGKINYVIDKTQMLDYKNNQKKEFKRPPAGSKTFLLDKVYSYEMMSSKVMRFNEDLNYYFKGSAKPDLEKLDKQIIPFLYYFLF